MFRVSQHPSSGILKTVTAASGTGHITGTATSLQRGPIDDDDEEEEEEEEDDDDDDDNDDDGNTYDTVSGGKTVLSGE